MAGVVALLALACAHSRIDVSPAAIANRADADSIRAARVAQNQAMADGDASRAAEFWTEDVTVRRGLGTPVNGRDAYRQLIESDVRNAARLVYERIPAEVEVSAHWPLAFETGLWRGRLGGASGPEVIGGRYSAQWVRRDDRWLIRSEVFVALHCQASGCDAAAVP